MKRWPCAISQVAHSESLLYLCTTIRASSDCFRFCGKPAGQGRRADDGGILFHYFPSTSMYLDSAKKAELFEKYGKSATDTGSPESQIALFTFRIAHLTGHLQKNKKDYSTQRALKMIIGKRRRMLDYLQKIDIERYRAIIKELGIRR